MSLLLPATSLVQRRTVALGGLGPLADSLANDLAPLVAGDVFIPNEKALLSRAGGRCPRHGVLLDFDPWAPHDHRCPVCGERFRGELHDRFWIYWYHLWLAERAVHAAVLHGLGGPPEYGLLAMRILEAYTERYLSYPNVDNVLGPARPFFSTYLESIWLLQLSVALDLLEETGARFGVGPLAGRMRDLLIEPSAALIASYNEGMSNRQVWNNAALAAAYRLLARPGKVEDVTFGRSGLISHLSEGLLSDGTWYEGENYHLFAHRGLWYGVVMAERASVEIPPSLVARFEEGFATPFLTALPDMTLPSRRDSPYAISLRQWRFAELCELGLARSDDPRLQSVLAHLYDDTLPARGMGRSHSSAEAERNDPATGLTRARLGWRSLLFACEELPPLAPLAPRSVLLDAQGFAVLRREGGRVYVALDYGHAGGGHGHPDRLNLFLVNGNDRWLDDMGTGSYVDPSLRWYRSTLAHNAPLVDGRSQARVRGRLLAFDEGGGVGWVAAEAEIAPGVLATRRVVVMPDYVIDVIEWDAASTILFDLPLHVPAASLELPGRAHANGNDPIVMFATAPLAGATGNDGFQFVHGTERAHLPATRATHLRAQLPEGALDLWISCDSEMELWRCRAPGPPGCGEQEFLVLRARAQNGRIQIVSSWRDAIQSVRPGQPIGIALRDGTRQEHHQIMREGWRVELHAGAAHSTIDLGGAVVPHESELAESAPSPLGFRAVASRPGSAGTIVLGRGRTVLRKMGMKHYRRSEDSWQDAGRPAATVRFLWDGEGLSVRVAVHHVDRSFAEPGAINPYDNEPADINGAGLQLYVARPSDHTVSRGSLANEAGQGWMLLPLAGSDTVAIRPIGAAATASAVSLRATWSPHADGYAIVARLNQLSVNPLPPRANIIGLQVIVNEKPFARERRRGQLVLTGAEGEFVYLRGDRNDGDCFVPIELGDA